MNFSYIKHSASLLSNLYGRIVDEGALIKQIPYKIEDWIIQNVWAIDAIFGFQGLKITIEQDLLLFTMQMDEFTY